MYFKSIRCTRAFEFTVDFVYGYDVYRLVLTLKMIPVGLRGLTLRSLITAFSFARDVLNSDS